MREEKAREEATSVESSSLSASCLVRAPITQKLDLGKARRVNRRSVWSSFRLRSLKKPWARWAGHRDLFIAKRARGFNHL